LDDQLLSAPTVDVTYAETGITGGTAVITGAFSEAIAATVAAQIRSGALPAPTAIVSREPVTLDDNCGE